jgi:hypothetical protein
MLCKKTVKNQITLPKKIVDRVGNCEYFEVKAENDRIILIPVKLVAFNETPKRLKEIRKKISSLGLTEKDIDDAVKWARSK